MSAPSDDEIRRTIDDLLAQRAEGKTICPSEVARALAPAPAWRDLMDDVRRVATDERLAGRLAFLQHGEPVDPSTARGPVRLARVT